MPFASSSMNFTCDKLLSRHKPSLAFLCSSPLKQSRRCLQGCGNVIQIYSRHSPSIENLHESRFLASPFCSSHSLLRCCFISIRFSPPVTLTSFLRFLLQNITQSSKSKRRERRSQPDCLQFNLHRNENLIEFPLRLFFYCFGIFPLSARCVSSDVHRIGMYDKEEASHGCLSGAPQQYSTLINAFPIQFQFVICTVLAARSWWIKTNGWLRKSSALLWMLCDLNEKTFLALIRRPMLLMDSTPSSRSPLLFQLPRSTPPHQQNSLLPLPPRSFRRQSLLHRSLATLQSPATLQLPTTLQSPITLQLLAITLLQLLHDTTHQPQSLLTHNLSSSSSSLHTSHTLL